MAVVTLSRSLPDIAALSRQAEPLDGALEVHVVRICAAGGEAAGPAAFRSQEHLSRHNLGGAGGFALAILSALAGGAEWVWMMDDDAVPTAPDCLAGLLTAAQTHRLQVVSPIIVAPEDESRLAFPFRVAGKLSYSRAEVEALGFLPSIAQFFNGALIHRDVFFKVGLPDMRLFLRGDEVDFLLRLRKAGIAFGTATHVAVAHPPGWGEVVPIVGDRLAILMPETRFRRYYFYRNRGYLARRYRRFFSFVADLVFYPYAFLVLRRGGLSGLREWAAAYWRGLRYDFTPPDDLR